MKTLINENILMNAFNKSLIAILITATSSSVFASNTKAESSAKKALQSQSCKADLTPKQAKVLKQSYLYGKPFNLGYSLAAIAWHESLAGEYLINVNDPSFGVHHILISTAANRANVTGIEKNRLALNIVKSHKLSASFAIKELLYWQENLKDNSFNNIWAAYNAGWNYKGSKGQYYASIIHDKVEWLKRCLK